MEYNIYPLLPLSPLMATQEHHQFIQPTNPAFSNGHHPDLLLYD